MTKGKLTRIERDVFQFNLNGGDHVECNLFSFKINRSFQFPGYSDRCYPVSNVLFLYFHNLDN